MPEIPAVHCEARKVAYRQSREGLVVSFVIHPNDMPDALAVAPLGTRYMLGLCEIGDDEQPVAREKPAPSKSEVAKAKYAASAPMGQALTRACLLADDLRFQQWVAGSTLCPASKDDAESYVRIVCCGGRSRGLIAEDPECYQRYIKLETEFKIFAGELPEPR